MNKIYLVKEEEVDCSTMSYLKEYGIKVGDRYAIPYEVLTEYLHDGHIETFDLVDNEDDYIVIHSESVIQHIIEDLHERGIETLEFDSFVECTADGNPFEGSVTLYLDTNKFSGLKYGCEFDSDYIYFDLFTDELQLTYQIQMDCFISELKKHSGKKIINILDI